LDTATKFFGVVLLRGILDVEVRRFLNALKAVAEDNRVVDLLGQDRVRDGIVIIAVGVA